MSGMKCKRRRDECGFKGHEWVCSDDDYMMSTRHMCQNFIDHMETANLKNGHQEKDMRYLKV